MGKKDKYQNKKAGGGDGSQQQGQNPPQQQGQQQQRPGPPQGQQQQRPGPSQGQQQQRPGPPQGQQQQRPGPPQGQQQQQPWRQPEPAPAPQGDPQAWRSQPDRPASSASSQGSQRQQRPQQPRSSVATEMMRKVVILSPTQALKMIESDKNGAVYQGTRGVKCNLEVNYLQILVKKIIPKAFHYDVEFMPDVPKKMLSAALDAFMAAHFPRVHFAFDGRKNFYTNQALKVGDNEIDEAYSQTVTAVLLDRSKEFKVTVKLATTIDMTVLANYQHPAMQHNDKPMQAVQCLDVVLRTAFKALVTNQTAVAAGRALYMAPTGRDQRPLGEGLELWYGLFQSAILGRKSLYLNVDVAHKAFPSAVPILRVVAELFSDRDGRSPSSLQEWQKTKLNDYLKMLTIGYKPPFAPVKSFGYNALVKSARDATFVKEDGTKMTVEQYYAREKNVKLNYPDMPCLHVGSRVRNIYLPMEFCELLAGQATNKKCTPNAVAQMIKYSATSTSERKNKIKNLLDRINYAQPGGVIQGFGIDIPKNFQNVEGRIINPPMITYRNGQKVKPMNGVWRADGKQFIDVPNEQVRWAVVNCDSRTSLQQITEFKKNISNGARGLGMNLYPSAGNQDYYPLSCRPNEIERALQDVLGKCQKAGYKIVFVIIIDQNDCYARVKQVAELQVGILTQCIKGNTIFKMGRGNPMMTINQILLKVNAKLSGKNQEVDETSFRSFNALNDGVMFVGADVTHPSPDQRDIPSVVGVACSYDQVGFRYQCAWRLQHPTKEMIEDLENILVEHLHFYKKKNNKLPGKIMYYRDGVSEGQFGEVLEIEMNAIRRAMTKIYGTGQPAKVTFVVVQKRHHTRFFPTDQRFSDGKNQNIPAGTVVDKDIVHPFQYQFFLASHAAIQGVTKPSKYCVLVNESKISPDDLQAITYDLCHLFTRCNRSVSYPAPTYYAHLVAARGKQYTIGRRIDMTRLGHEYNQRLIKNEIVNNCPMFFV